MPDAISMKSNPDTPADGTMPLPEVRDGSEIMEDEFERALREIAGEAASESASESTALTVVPAPEEEAKDTSYITEEVCVRIRNMLGIKPESWERIMPEVRSLVPKYALHKIAARVSLNMGFENIGQLSQAVELGKGIMEDTKVEAITRVAAGKMISNAVEAMGKMFPELLRLADAGGDKTAADEKANGASNKPRNLPPMLNLQVNVGSGGPPTSPGGPPTYAVGAVVKSGNGIRNLPPSK
jgi:hypothetical protein